MTTTFDNKIYDIIKDGGGGVTTFNAGDAIDISDNTINVKYDNSSITKNSNNQLYVPIVSKIQLSKQTESNCDFYIIEYLGGMITMYIFYKQVANTNLKINFNDETKRIIQSKKPFYVQSMGYNHTITGVNSDVYSFTATSGNGGSISFSDTTGITIIIGDNDDSYNHNFVAYYY